MVTNWDFTVIKLKSQKRREFCLTTDKLANATVRAKAHKHTLHITLCHCFGEKMTDWFYVKQLGTFFCKYVG